MPNKRPHTIPLYRCLCISIKMQGSVHVCSAVQRWMWLLAFHIRLLDLCRSWPKKCPEK